EGTGQVRVANRIGVRVLNAPASLPSDGGLAEVRASQSDSVRVEMLFRNTGPAPVELHGTLEIRDLAGTAVVSAQVGPLGVLPAHARRLTTTLPALPPGDYLAVPVLDFGAEWLAAGQALLTVRRRRAHGSCCSVAGRSPRSSPPPHSRLPHPPTQPRGLR